MSKTTVEPENSSILRGLTREEMHLSHLFALELSLSHERGRLARARSVGERELRSVWVAQIEREIASERRFLGLGEPTELSDDELLAELSDLRHSA